MKISECARTRTCSISSRAFTKPKFSNFARKTSSFTFSRIGTHNKISSIGFPSVCYYDVDKLSRIQNGTRMSSHHGILLYNHIHSVRLLFKTWWMTPISEVEPRED